MGRFATHAFGWTLAATVFWWLSGDAIAPCSIAAARLLHRIAGVPAPYLIVEVLDYFWLAPPAQLFVGLTLASCWVPRWRRLACLAVGFALLWFLVVMHIIAISSPYLGAGQGRYLLGAILAKGHLIVLPIIVWLVLTPLPASSLIDDRRTQEARRGRVVNLPFRKWLWRPIAAGSMCLLIPVGLYLLSAADPPGVRAARRSLAASIREGNPRQTILAAARLGNAQERASHRVDQHLYYLVGRLCQAAGRQELARTYLLHPSIDPKVRAVLQAELTSDPGSARGAPSAPRPPATP